MPERPDRDRIGEALDGIAGNTSRRGFIARVGGAMMAATAGSVVGRAIEPGEADAYHFCGHIFTTGSCVHPNGHAADRRRRLAARGETRASPSTTSAARSTRRACRSTANGNVLQRPRRPPDARRRRAPRSATRPRASTRSTPRSTAPGTAAAAAPSESSSTAARSRTQRINGDASLTGYCFSGRKVFCVMYFQTKVPC